MKQNKYLFALVTLLSLSLTGCSNPIEKNVIDLPLKANDDDKGEVAFNCIRGDVDVKYLNYAINQTLSFNITPDEGFSVYKVEHNGKEIKSSGNNHYEIKIEKSNYVRVLFDYSDKDFVFRTYGDLKSYTIIDYKGKDVANIGIPRFHNGFPVNGIDEYALYGHDEIKTIYHPETFSYSYFKLSNPLDYVYFYKENANLYSNGYVYSTNIICEGKLDARPDIRHGDISIFDYCISEIFEEKDYKYVIRKDENSAHCYATSFKYLGKEENVSTPNGVTFKNINYPIEKIVFNDENKFVKSVEFSPVNIDICLFDTNILMTAYVKETCEKFETKDRFELTIYYRGNNKDLFVGGALVIYEAKGDFISKDGFTYYVEGDSAKLIKYDYHTTYLELPNTINHNGKDVPITCIGPNAFKNSRTRAVVANEALERIEYRAFGISLQYFKANKNLKYIGDYAFHDDTFISKLENVEYIGEQGMGINSLFHIPKALKHFDVYIWSENTTVYTELNEDEFPIYWHLTSWFGGCRFYYGKTFDEVVNLIM